MISLLIWLFEFLFRHPYPGRPRELKAVRAIIIVHSGNLCLKGISMLTLDNDHKPVGLKYAYVNKNGGPAKPPADAKPPTWTNSNPDVVTLSETDGPDNVMTIVEDAEGETLIGATDGVFPATLDTQINGLPAVGAVILADTGDAPAPAPTEGAAAAPQSNAEMRAAAAAA